MKPEDRIRTYLFAHKSRVELSTLDLVVKDVKLDLFYGMSPISDDEIRNVVKAWASIHAAGLILRTPPGGASAPPAKANTQAPADSELIAAAKKAVSTVVDGITVGRRGANINISVTGLTANLRRRNKAVSLNLGWSGALKLDANSGPFHFSGQLSKDKWELTLSFPQDTYIPDLSSLGKVFTEGEKAVISIADASRNLKSVSDAGKIGALVKPHTAAVQEAVDAASGIAKASEKGGASFGFKLGSPEPMPGEQGIPRGVQGSVVFTYVF